MKQKFLLLGPCLLLNSFGYGYCVRQPQYGKMPMNGKVAG